MAKRLTKADIEEQGRMVRSWIEAAGYTELFWPRNKLKDRRKDPQR